MKGLFAWIGFPQKAVLYDRDARFAGDSKFNYWKLWNFAIEGITSFTTLPLKLATYLGLGVAALAFAFGAWIVFRTMLFGNPVAGYPSLIVVVLFLGGVQLAFIGILGEYVGRMFDESKARPLYLVQRHVQAGLLPVEPGVEGVVNQAGHAMTRQIDATPEDGRPFTSTQRTHGPERV
jgi:glycosyltransferase involved in cell wall biosynthesis